MNTLRFFREKKCFVSFKIPPSPVGVRIITFPSFCNNCRELLSRISISPLFMRNSTLQIVTKLKLFCSKGNASPGCIRCNSVFVFFSFSFASCNMSELVSVPTQLTFFSWESISNNFPGPVPISKRYELLGISLKTGSRNCRYQGASCKWEKNF